MTKNSKSKLQLLLESKMKAAAERVTPVSSVSSPAELPTPVVSTVSAIPTKPALSIKERLAAKVAEKAAARQYAPISTVTVDTPVQEEMNKLVSDNAARLMASEPTPQSVQPILVPHTASVIQHNAKQQEFIDLAVSGKSCALTGAAGCGKTTSLTGMLEALIHSEVLNRLNSLDHKFLVNNSPSIAFISFTNKAVSNIKKVLPKDIRDNAMTAHKLLEFEPDYYDEVNPVNGAVVTKMKFAPTRHRARFLPRIQILIIDEAPMLPVSLWNQIAEALDPNYPVQLILVGDIQQLPPVFGKSVFIHAIQGGMPYVELTEVYRQALGSPIIRLATEILKGKQIPMAKFKELEGETDKGIVKIFPWKQKLSDLAALKLMHLWLPEQIDKGTYKPMEHIIITPYNEAFGTIELNKIIANHLAKKLEAPVYEVFAGIKKCYFRVGERVLYNKSDATILSIERNKAYYGKSPRAPSPTLTYAGVETDSAAAINAEVSAEAAEEIDFMLEAMANHLKDDERGSSQASHIIKLRLTDLDSEVQISTTGDVSKLDLGYCITIYKSQGSEYDTVFLLTHASQGGQIFRESVYTAVTRAKKRLNIVCEPNFLVKGINTQRLVGNNLKEKIASFERMLEVQKTAPSEMPIRKDLFTSSVPR